MTTTPHPTPITPHDTRKGIVLAGGSGSRLYPLTSSISKQLLPVYDKPMVYYPIATLMLAGIREILIICMDNQLELFKNLLGDGSNWGIEISYAIQDEPNGIAEAFIIGADFIGDASVALNLGDNIFYGHGLEQALAEASNNPDATVFTYHVRDPERYGVVGFDSDGNPSSIIEKPEKPESNYAVTGLYMYSNDVVEMAKTITPSARGELEITDINQQYLDDGRLSVVKLGRGSAWLDTGTLESLNQAANYIQTIEQRQGLKICCPEEVAWRMNFISSEQLLTLSAAMGKSDYGQYLREILGSDL